MRRAAFYGSVVLLFIRFGSWSLRAMFRIEYVSLKIREPWTLDSPLSLVYLSCGSDGWAVFRDSLKSTRRGPCNANCCCCARRSCITYTSTCYLQGINTRYRHFALTYMIQLPVVLHLKTALHRVPHVVMQRKLRDAGLAEIVNPDGSVPSYLTVVQLLFDCVFDRCLIVMWRDALKATQSEHPVLGRLIADLGYKRVFLTSIEAVVQAPVWEKRKLLRPVRAIEIAQAKMMKKNVVRA